MTEICLTDLAYEALQREGNCTLFQATAKDVIISFLSLKDESTPNISTSSEKDKVKENTKNKPYIVRP